MTSRTLSSSRSHQFRKPSVYVTESEFERLSNLAESNHSSGAALLGDELVRALVLKDGEFPSDFVRLGSFVEFTDLMTGRTRRVQIVLPDDALDVLQTRDGIGLECPDCRAALALVLGATHHSTFS